MAKIEQHIEVVMTMSIEEAKVVEAALGRCNEAQVPGCYEVYAPLNEALTEIRELTK